MRKLSWTLAVFLAASVFFFAICPAGPEVLDTAAWGALAARTAAGAYHVHTTRSDGHADRAAVAAAAARAGLTFVILTDHGDGTRPPDPPEYLAGVLIVDAVEISTDNGHYVALDMPRAPYPLGGAAEAVVEDVHRLGGFGIAAHPDSPKAALRWTDIASPIDGIEWINADSEWRDETGPRLVETGLAYFLRPAGALATLLDRPATLDRWDGRLRHRRVIGLGASDAHGGAGRRAEDQGRTLFGTAGIPSYEASFRELSIRAVLDRPFSRDAAEDARALLAAIRKGNVFTAIDALAAPAALDFHAVPTGATVTLEARATLPRGAELVLLGPDGEVARAAGDLRREVPAAGFSAYRVEVSLPGAPGEPRVPWLVSNPIIVGDSAPGTQHSAPSTEHRAPSTIAPFPWRIEKDPASSAILRTSASSVELQYKLADGPRASQFVALATDIQGQRFGAIDFGLSSDRPARVAVQVRSADGRRWGRSFYADPAGSSIRARLADLRPVSGQAPAMPPSTELSSILLVVDLTNAGPGRAGILTVSSSALAK